MAHATHMHKRAVGGFRSTALANCPICFRSGLAPPWACTLDEPTQPLEGTQQAAAAANAAGRASGLLWLRLLRRQLMLQRLLVLLWCLRRLSHRLPEWGLLDRHHLGCCIEASICMRVALHVQPVLLSLFRLVLYAAGPRQCHMDHIRRQLTADFLKPCL